MKHPDKDIPIKHGDKEHGEGNYKASKDYNDRTKQFIDSGQVEGAAQKAKPKNAKEEREMLDAEEEGKSHARSKDS